VPGLNAGDISDAKNCRFIRRSVKDKTRYIKLLPIVINGQTRSVQKSTLNTIAIYEEIFGLEFWKMACIVITHYSNSPDSV
jgi:hypothetical protein